jgi:hypothetical protein
MCDVNSYWQMKFHNKRYFDNELYNWSLFLLDQRKYVKGKIVIDYFFCKCNTSLGTKYCSLKYIELFPYTGEKKVTLQNDGNAYFLSERFRMFIKGRAKPLNMNNHRLFMAFTRKLLMCFFSIVSLARITILSILFSFSNYYFFRFI